MTYHTKNLSTLQTLFCSSKIHFHSNDGYLYDFYKHKKAKVMGILLANAKIATPELNRATVTGLLNGTCFWPKSDGSAESINIDIGIELFEKLGLLSFYADWLEIHCRPIKDESSVHCTVKPLIRALKTLTQIKWGEEGFIEPHFSIRQEIAISLVKEFADKTYLDQMKELNVKAADYEILLVDNELTRLISSYLWQELIKENSSDKSFLHWIQITRIYSARMEKPHLNNFKDKDKKAFLDRTVEFIVTDHCFSQSWTSLNNQVMSEYSFNSYLVRKNRTLNMTIDLNTGQNLPPSVTEDNIESRPLNQLQQCYPDFAKVFHSILDIINWYRNQNSWKEIFFGYGLIANLIENDIHIYRGAVSEHGRISRLLSASQNKDAL